MESELKKAKLPYPLRLFNEHYSKNKTLSNYLSFYRDDKLPLFYSLILYIVKSSPTWTIPIVTSNIINLLEDPNPSTPQNLLIQFIIGAVFIMQNIPTHIWFVQTLSSVNRKVEMTLRSALCTRLQHLSIPYHTNNKIGELQIKILRDVENVEQLTRMLVEALPGVVISFIVAITVTAIRAPKFIFFYLVMAPIAALIYHWLKGKLVQYNLEFRQNVESMSGRVIEMLRLITVTRAHGVEATELDRVNVKLQEVKDSGIRLDILNSVFGSVNWVALMTFNLFALFIAAFLKNTGKLDVGLGTIVLLANYFAQISGSVMQLMNLVPAIAKGFESVKSIGEVLECPDIEMNDSKPTLQQVEGNFKFEHVSFAYENGGHKAVNDFSLDVKRGETIALVGPSGSGKSTVMQLLIGFIRPTEGKIFLDGKDMNELDLRSYRQFISVVSQESILFNGSIKQNITYGAEYSSEEEIRQAVESANLKDFIDSLPEGLDTEVKEGGGRLSGGQKQRMAIARALLRNPQVLLLDEATSALDVESEALIQDALDRLIKGRTTFIVAHRLSTIRNADRIIVLIDGKISEIGNHHDLMEEHGVYYRMNLLQSKELSNEDAKKLTKELGNWQK